MVYDLKAGALLKVIKKQTQSSPSVGLVDVRFSFHPGRRKLPEQNLGWSMDTLGVTYYK
jgi:hypothetical protein